MYSPLETIGFAIQQYGQMFLAILEIVGLVANRGWTMTPVPSRIVNSVSCVKRINHENFFSWQAQYFFMRIVQILNLHIFVRTGLFLDQATS